MKTYKTYHVTLVQTGIQDCTEVDAEDEAEARMVAYDIFRENDYDLAADELIVEEAA